MKYMLKKIFIGVAIGTILFIIKGGNVFASSVNLYNASSIVGTMSFDLCTTQNDNLLCIDGFTKSLNLKSSNTTRIYTNTGKDIMLKSFSMSFSIDPSAMYVSGSYFALTSPMTDLFYNFESNKKLQTNFMPVYVKMTMVDDTECEITDNVGYDFSSGSRRTYPYWKTPSACMSKYLKKVDIIFQSGYNYSGSNDILSDIENDSNWTSSEWLSHNKNNTYLLWWHNQNIVLKSDVGNLQLYNGSGWGSSKVNNTYTIEEQEINENLAKLEKEKYFASLGGTDLGPDSPSQSNYDDIEDKITDVQLDLSSATSSTQFTDFLNALTQKPIVELLYLIRNDPTDDTTVSCGITPYIPFKVNHNNDTSVYGMNLPCVSDYLEDIPYMYGWNAFGFGVINIYQMLLSAYLTYLLILTWLNLIKYTITRSSSEIEVIEL